MTPESISRCTIKTDHYHFTKFIKYVPDVIGIWSNTSTKL